MKTLKLTLLALAAGLTLSFSSFAQGKVEETSVIKTTEYYIAPTTLLVPSKGLPSVSNVYWRIQITMTDTIAGRSAPIGPVDAKFKAERIVLVRNKDGEASYPDGEWSGSINFRANDVQNQLNDLTFGLQAKKREEQVTIVIPPIKEEEIDEVQK